MGFFRREPPDENAEIVREHARELVLPGFTSRDEARATIREIVEDDDELHIDVDRAVAILDQVWDQRLREQRSWRGLSDADRLDAAFAELEAVGVVARMSFSCCGTCGASEIYGEVVPGTAPMGYVFFHQQDADGLADREPTLFLSYGAFAPDWRDDEQYEQAAVAVGEQVRRSLEANGLRVEWDGTHARRIGVVGLDWRRRLPA